ncbi:GTP-binding protein BRASSINAZOLE INSENSITIVE PALE GREEN 2, chloroplastic [Macadamia integrifolia]|uniref:GTP-binding protein BRASSINAZOLE INSENSITIVE PALE GREEN 2, chloroplastic n=1 Tax=Macadamia integrifolia TaxID=60698 RepID=UPI001C4E6768|nr:GTP-binding protein BRASSINAZOLE INSENSITIVE PALE GREEN 2, chloroplastic [Macadamia integrifolia]XP_042485878.1 GTP-binding protein BRASSINAZOLE INSENSITIVE PALE GREEN 2, chloroplastic [Macadamia integrifolia]XP_042485879.1 GTP-binding protein BRASSINAZOLE INSENSITIVE PALE GREEN 2, chloroplastic [Macadamia integrifolia]XP_042485880.1 GTP-binding protein BRASSINAZOLE INSENSITIVE PALE GREEN 2, chloroplastic [Macadamia integrifolia]XP_042485881.1 GTP-binding protein BRASSINAZOLE INSENSITIVE PAL
MSILLSTETLLQTTTTKLRLKLSNNGRNEGEPILYGLFAGIKKVKNNKINRGRSVCSIKVVKTTVTPTQIGKSQRNHARNPVLSEGRDEDENHGLICPGCGIFMQDKDPNLPGFYQERREFQKESAVLVEAFDGIGVDEFTELSGEEEEEESMDDIQSKFEASDEEYEKEDVIDWDSDDWESLVDDEDENWRKELDGFAPAGLGYGNITEEMMKKVKKERISKSGKKQKARESQRDEEMVTVCARCHSLRNYGQVKNPNADNLIPDFDFDRLITTRLMKPGSNSGTTVVVMVVDCVDFDGSFPKRAAKSLFRALERSKNDVKLSKKLPKLALVATKVDLLPSEISPTRLDRWVRNRAKAGGAPKLNGVYLVSSRKDLGVRNLLSFIKELAGPRGNVWVIGAQNAGKSTLINAFSKKEGRKITKLTEAAVPGTTLGILRVGGILPAKAKMYDTPGLLHPYLMSMRLNRDEQKMIEIRKELKPRTYRMKAGQAVHVGGLIRLDLNQASVETIYVTIWFSPNVSLHLGKIENADEIWKKHAGVRLQPPIGVDRVPELGKWERREFKVSGSSWDVNSIDIAVAGFGWFSFGLKGEATLALWTYDGIEITLREPLVLDRAQFLERSGFLLPKAISDAIGNQTKLEARKKKKLQDNEIDSPSEVLT